MTFSNEGARYVKFAMILAPLLYVSGCFIVNSQYQYVAPLGYVLSTLGFLQLYRVGFSCTSISKTPAFKSDALRRIMGQISLLLLMRPIISLRTNRESQAPESSRVWGSRHFHWVCYKIRQAYNLGQQIRYAKEHPKLRQHVATWVALQFTAVLVFAAVFFSLLLSYSGLSGVVRYWLIPFAAMHMQLGSMSLTVSKKQTRANADGVFKVLTGRSPRVATRKIQVDPVDEIPSSPKVAKVSKLTPKKQAQAPSAKLHWFNIIYLSLVHVGALYGASLAFGGASSKCLLFALGCFMISQLGVTGGAHRLWAHRSYSAHTSVQCLLMFFCAMANEGSILKWARDHRLHHKHVDTPMDPHDATRGFWYSHIGWLFTRKSDEVLTAGKNVHMDDLYNNKVVMFQHRNYPWMSLLCCFLIPTLACNLVVGQDAWTSFWVVGMLRYVLVLHGTWFVNSLAHLWGWGSRPYLANILPCDNLFVAICSMGEGWHNYHHAYPYDYSANEYGWWQWNPTTLFLDTCSKLGLVYDRRRAHPNKGKSIPDSELPRFSMEDVKTSAGQAAMLLVIDDYVYDVARFVDEKLHPGGETILKAYIGKDVSKVFKSGAKHSHTEAAYNLLKGYRMGVLVDKPTCP